MKIVLSYHDGWSVHVREADYGSFMRNFMHNCGTGHSSSPTTPHLLEIAILRFGVLAREPGYAEQSTSPIRDIRRRLRKSGYPDYRME